MSHAVRHHPYADDVKVREPVARPLDVVAAELLLSAAQAFLTGVLMYLAVGMWEDRGVGAGPVAVILALLGIAVGGAWLYWLLGGTGWPMAAANVPAAMFFGFALILGWQGNGLIELDALPILLALAASVYGVVAGVFLDSPRRWRWDQRQRLRPGTEVPRVSEPTRELASRLRRPSLARSRETPPPTTPASSSTLDAPKRAPSEDVGIPYVADTGSTAREAGSAMSAPASAVKADDAGQGETVSSAAAGPSGTPSEGHDATTRDAAPARRKKGQSTGKPTPTTDASRKGAEPAATPGGIELPTSVEPKAQRSPWAWAAPPEWARDDETDEPAGGRKGSS